MAMQIKYAFSEDVVIIHDAAGYKPNDITGTWDFYDKDGEFLESAVMEEGAEIKTLDEPA
jgi:hypothetical protein